MPPPQAMRRTARRMRLFDRVSDGLVAPAFPSPLAGEGQGGGRQKDSCDHAPSPPLQPKSDVSDFGRPIRWSISGKPEIDCKRGREHTEVGPRFVATL